jgi:hypothetical protein
VRPHVPKTRALPTAPRPDIGANIVPNLFMEFQ